MQETIFYIFSVFQPALPEVNTKLESLQAQIKRQIQENEDLLESLRKLREESKAG